MTAKAKAKPKPKRTSKPKVTELTPEALMAQVNATLGEGVVKKASDPSFRIQREPTGILALDWLFSGGFPRNRMIEIHGDANVGKNYTAFKFIAECQRAGLTCAWVACEPFQQDFAEIVGVDTDKLLLHPQEHGSTVVNFMEMMLRSQIVDVVVLDSIAALLPKSEWETDMEAGSYGTEQARLMSKALRKLTAANKKTVLIMLNQQREAIGVVFGKKTTTSGGRARTHYAGIRLELVRIELLKKDGKDIDPKTGEIKKVKIPVGHRILARVEKDKTGSSRPFEEVTFVFNYEKGVHDPVEDLFYLGRVTNLVRKDSKNNFWYNEYPDEKVKGKVGFKKWLRANRAIREELEEEIRDLISSKIETYDEDPQEDGDDEE